MLAYILNVRWVPHVAKIFQINAVDMTMYSVYILKCGKIFYVMFVFDNRIDCKNELLGFLGGFERMRNVSVHP